MKKTDDVQPEGVRLYKHPDTGTYQDPREGTTGCPVGPPGTEGATGGIGPDVLNPPSWGLDAPGAPPLPSASTRGVVLTNEERLTAENIQLHIIVLLDRKGTLIRKVQEDLSRLEIAMNAQREKVSSFQEAMTTKYSIDFTKEMIEPETGRIIAVPKEKG